MSANPRAKKTLELLRQSHMWTSATKENAKYITGLVCPACGQPEAFVHKDWPWMSYCNRKNECGKVTPISELLPDPVATIEQDFPPTPDDPHRPATAYLNYRGLDKALEGLEYNYWSDIRQTGCGGVMFSIPQPDGSTSYNGRLFNPPEGEGKTHNRGELKNPLWKHPGLEYKTDAPTYVCEGIINALSLIEMGYQAVAVLSAGANPAKLDLSEFGNLVLAFDNDHAGRQATRRWAAYIKKQTGESPRAILPVGGDWNDFLLAHGDGAPDEFEKKLSEMRTEAELALAQTSMEFATILEGKRYYTGIFTYNGQTYYSYFKGYGTSLKLHVKHLGNFTVKILHYQLDTSIPEKPVHTYHMEVRVKGGKPKSFTATAQELASPHNLRQMFLERALVLFKGETTEALSLIQHILRNAPVVRQLHMTGYDMNSGCYVYKRHMIDREGKLIVPDKNGFFRVSESEYVRPANIDTILPVDGPDTPGFLEKLFTAWGCKAMVALAWMVAAIFVNQVKPVLGWFPFLSLYGDPQTGKTNLVRNLNALQCMDEEGLPMRKVNTSKGEIRTIAQRSGGFTALLEGSAGSNIRFDLDTLLTLYDLGNPLQVRAKKTNNLDLEKIPFNGALMFVQNVEPFKERKHKERVVSLEFKTEELTDETRRHCIELKSIPLGAKAAVFVAIMKHRVTIEKQWHSYYLSAVEVLKTAGVTSRLQETHGLILGFYNLLSTIFGFEYDLTPYVISIAEKKERQCEDREETAADRFLDILMSMDRAEPTAEGETRIDTSGFLDLCGDKVFVHRTLAEKAIRASNYVLNYTGEQLTAALNQHPAVLENNRPHRFNGPNRKAIVFSLPILQQNI